MDFEIIEEQNIKVILKDNNEEKASCECYYKNTPKDNGVHVGCIGNLEIKDYNYGVELLKKAEEVLKNKGITRIVGPMNGNTWKKYRTMKYTRGDTMFLLENVDPIEYNKIFQEAGFTEIYTYTSNKGLIQDAYKSEIIDMAEENLKQENIVIRKFNKENAVQDLKKIYNISKQCFSRNPLYVEIEEEDFIKQYTDYINMIDEDLVLIAEKNNEEVGFVFCMPNYNEMKESGSIQTVILKTIAVLPEYEEMALGNVLLKQIAEISVEKGFKEWIFAFMYSNNTSQKMAKRNKAEIIREYAIYGKNLD